MQEFRQNRKRWLENEWRDAYHFGALDKHELHKRWFGQDVIAWLTQLVSKLQRHSLRPLLQIAADTTKLLGKQKSPTNSIIQSTRIYQSS